MKLLTEEQIAKKKRAKERRMKFLDITHQYIFGFMVAVFIFSAILSATTGEWRTLLWSFLALVFAVKSETMIKLLDKSIALNREMIDVLEKQHKFIQKLKEYTKIVS